nr:retrovirus-related Pol polyprotein from transposon TNT 1-94 [Tanacetum cinerariifolium]
MNPTATSQIALDNALVLPKARLKIGECNRRIKFSKPQREATYQVTLDALKLSPFYPAFLITARVLEIYMHQFWNTVNKICPKLSDQPFDIPPSTDEEIVSFITKLGYTGNIETLPELFIDHMHQPWRTFAAVINRFTKIIINHFISQNKSISMRNKINLHTARDDSLLGTLKYVSKTEEHQVYGALIPKEMINEDILNSTSYQTYYAYASGAKEPKKGRKFKKPASPQLKTVPVSLKEPTKKPGKAKKDITSTKKTATKTKPTKKKAPIKADKGDGIDFELKVPDEQQHKISGDSGEEHDDEDDAEDDDGNDDGDDSDGNDDDDNDGNDEDDSDHKRTESDRDENPNLNHSNQEHKDEEEEYVNEFTDKEDDADKSGFEQEEEDAYVTLTAVHDTQKTEGPMQSSSISSDFIEKLLNFKNVSPVDNEIASLMDTTVYHEKPSGQKSFLYTVPVKVIPESRLPSPKPFLHHLLPSILFYNKQHQLPHQQLQKCREKALADGREYIDLIDTSLRAIIKEKVNSQLPQILRQVVLEFATHVVERNITESLEATVLAKSLSQPKSIYEAAASLSKFELMKILIDKMAKHKSYLRADYKKELYDVLVKSYNIDKDLFDTCGEVFTLKRSRDDKDKVQDPSTGSDRGTKRRKSSKDDESSRDPKSKESNSTSSSNEFDMGNNDEQLDDKAASKVDWFKKPEQPLTLDPDWNKRQHVDFRPPQTWISNIARVDNPPTSFDELMETPIDFSAFIMNQLNITNLTQEILVRPTKAATYEVQWIEDMVPNIWSPVKDVDSRKHIIAVTSLKIMKRHDYGHLDEIKVRREDQQLYKFKEGDLQRLRLQDIEEILLLLVQQELTNLTIDKRFELNVALCGKDCLPMLAPVAEGSSGTTTEGYMENYKNVLQDIRDQLNTVDEAIQIILTGIDNDIYSTVDAYQNACEIDEMSKEKEIDKLMALISLSFKKIYKPTNNNLRTSSNTSRAHQDNTLRINRGTRNMGMYQGNVRNQNGKRMQLITRKRCYYELEAHYMYIAHIQEVTPHADDNSRPIFDTEPLQKVQNDDDNYSVFVNDKEHLEQPESANDTNLEKQGDTNITIDSLDMCNNGETVDQDDDLAKERDFLASLIEKLKCEIDDSKNRNKFLESSNKALVDKFKGEIEDFKTKNKLESSNNHFKEANNKLSKTNQLMFKDLKKFQAEPYRKCMLNGNHDMCVNGVNSRTRQPIAVPISTREPKRNVNRSVVTSHKKIVAIESTVRKPRSIIRKLYEQVSKTCSWWHPKFTPSRYKWKPKSPIRNVNANVSMPLGNASRTANILEPMTPRCSTMSNTPLSSNSLAARRDNSIHHRLWGKPNESLFTQRLPQAPKDGYNFYTWTYVVPWVESINGKKYVLIIVDDYSRYTWTYFLRSKDETPEVLIDFLKLVQRGLHAQLEIDGEMCKFTLTVSQTEPKNIKEAMANSAWIKAMHDELHQFDRLDVWELVNKPLCKNVINMKWLWKNKRDEENTVIHNKARLVAEGYNQHEGIDLKSHLLQ